MLYVWAHMPQCACGVQRTTLWSYFSIHLYVAPVGGTWIIGPVQQAPLP